MYNTKLHIVGEAKMKRIDNLWSLQSSKMIQAHRHDYYFRKEIPLEMYKVLRISKDKAR